MIKLKDLKEKNGLYYVSNIVNVTDWVTKSEALSILESYNQMINDEEPPPPPTLETLLQLKNDQIRILREIIDNREEMITVLEDSIQSHEKYIEELNRIINNLKILLLSPTQNIANRIEDVVYLRDKLLAAMKVPKTFY
jgi:hypothetical protein